MNELELLARMRDEVPHGEVSAHAASTFAAGIADHPEPGARTGGRAARPAAWPAGGRAARRAVRDIRPRWRVALVGGLAAALAAVTVVAIDQPATTSTATAFTAAELAQRAAVAAASQPEVRPGQWVYRKVLARPGTPFVPAGASARWATADNKANAFYVHGALIVGPWSSWGRIGCVHRRNGIMHPFPCLPGKQRYLKFPLRQWFVSYPSLGSLPSSPRTLIKVLASKNPQGLRWNTLGAGAESLIPLCKPNGRHCTGESQTPGAGSLPFRAFNVISYLLSTYVMPPALTAELYRALGDIAGIEVYRHLTDVAGRTGIGFVLRSHRNPGLGESIILNPRTYQFMAFGDQQGGIAVLRQALVARPGQLPKP